MKSLLKLFSGPSPEKMEQKADALFEAGQWGQAKMEYERTLDKLEKGEESSPDSLHRLAAKIGEAKEALAREHHENAVNLAGGGNFEEAQDLISLALELTGNPELTRALEDERRKIADQQEIAAELEDQAPLYGLGDDVDDESPEMDGSEDDYFIALCGTLPPEIKDAYLTYGDDFKTGYIALNTGDFQTAVEALSRALAAQPAPDSYIPLELATALLNMGRSADARQLLEPFLAHHPDALPAYQLLCEIYWEEKNFDGVTALLDTVPADLTQSLAVVLLKGETLYQAGDYAAARDFYLGFLTTYPPDDTIARALAKTYEALHDTENARKIYREMMARCTGCRTRIEPEIKHKYAELCYADGMRGTDVLELFLSLAQEIPDNAAAYFEKISHIYTDQGNTTEAKRFESFAKRASEERG